MSASDLEERLLVLDEHLHHLPLVAHVVQRRDGVHVGRTHEGGAEHDGQVLGVHQVELLVLSHPEKINGNRCKR